MNHWSEGGWGSGEWLAMGLMMLVFWGGLTVVALAWLRSTRRGHQPERSTGDKAERLLNERFARGDIDEEEFARRREVLRR